MHNLMTHVSCRRALALSLLAATLDSEGWTALWYRTPDGGRLVTDAPIEVVRASCDLVRTAMALPRELVDSVAEVYA